MFGPRAALGCLAGTLVALSAAAGEGVTFSDKWSDRRPATQPGRETGRRFSLENPFGSFNSGSSSLHGIAAPPFSPPEPTPLSPRERELLEQRRDWIMQTPGDRMRDSDAVNRAFGVREYAPETSKKESDTEKGTLLRYYEKLQATDAAAAKVVRAPADSATTDSLSPLGLGGAPRFGAPRPFRSSLEPARGSLGAPRLNDIAANGFRGESLTPDDRQLGRWERPFEPSSSERRPSLAFGPAESAAESGELTGIQRVLGAAPLAGPVTPLNRGPITSLDPVTTYPDPTREALNPVVSSPVGGLGSPLQAGPGTRDRSLTMTPSAGLRDLGNNPLRGSSEIFGSAAPASSSSRTLNSMKVQLEMPRRSF